MDTPNAVVVGYGYAGRYFHAPLITLASGLNLYGVVSGRAEAREEIQQRLGVKTFAHFEEALAEPQVDVVVLATPNDLHAPQAIEARLGHSSMFQPSFSKPAHRSIHRKLL